jgi:hypothetical protein
MNLKIIALILITCTVSNYFAAPINELNSYSIVMLLLGAIAETLGSMALPLIILLFVFLYKKFKKIKITFRTVELFIYISVFCALLNSVPNVLTKFS